jgi:hypothetical protein
MIDEIICHLEVLLESTGIQLEPAPCACVRATAEERGTYAAMHKYYHNNFTADRQNRYALASQRGGSAVFTYLNTELFFN